MITNSIIVALITGLLSFLGIVYTSKQAHDSLIEEIKGEIRLLKKDITNLEEKQDKHNTLIERMYQVEKEVDILDEKQKVSQHRIEDLEAGK